MLHDIELSDNEKHDFIMDHYPNIYNTLCANFRYIQPNGDVIAACNWFNVGAMGCKYMEIALSNEVKQ